MDWSHWRRGTGAYTAPKLRLLSVLPYPRKPVYNAHGSFALPLSSHKVAFKVQWEEWSLDVTKHDTVGFIISIFPGQE